MCNEQWITLQAQVFTLISEDWDNEYVIRLVDGTTKEQQRMLY